MLHRITEISRYSHKHWCGSDPPCSVDTALI